MERRPAHLLAEPRDAIAAPAEHMLAYREGASWAWILPDAGAPSLQPADVTLTSRRLVLMGENWLELGLQDIVDVVLGGEHLLVELGRGFGLLLTVEQPDAFQLALSKARRAFRDGQVGDTEPSDPHPTMIERG